MNVQLRQFYEQQWNQLQELVHSSEKVSLPLLLSVPNGYHETEVKLMIVGQQTHGWGNESDLEPEPVVGLMKLYNDFDLGSTVRHSPFWQAAHNLYRRINPSGPERSFLWTNLVKVDQKATRPSREIEDWVSTLDLVPQEVKITSPDVIVFFTGPRYDERLRRTFRGANRVKIADSVERVIHPALPEQTYRTYHPKYLRLSRRWSVIDEIAEIIVKSGT